MIRIAKRTLRKVTKEQKGQALAIVLVLLAVGGLLIMPTLGLGFTTLKGYQVTERKTMELYAADSGVEDGLHWLIKGRPKEGPWVGWDEGAGLGERQAYTINGRTVNVTVEKVCVEGLPVPNTYKVTSEAGSTTVLSTVWAITYFPGGQVFDNQNPPPSGDIWVDGDVTFAGNIEFTGTLIATGSVTTVNNSQITGDLLILGDLVLENNSEIHGTVCCGGDITVGNGSLLCGDIHLLGEDGTVTLTESGAGIEGDIWADGDLVIDIVINASIQGNIYTPDDVYEPPTGGDIIIYLRGRNSEIIGHVYASGTIEVPVEEGRIVGSTNPGWSEFSEPPACPGFPDRKASIYTYEIT